MASRTPSVDELHWAARIIALHLDFAMRGHCNAGTANHTMYSICDTFAAQQL
jgi:hypothetical protein